MKSTDAEPALRDALPDTVPQRYRGVWQRTLLQTPEGNDTATTVYWLQTARWHADIRIPAHRPDFSSVRSLAECSPAQLAWLACQQGFAGVTTVSAAMPKETCKWHRLIDFQPPAVLADAGYMSFEPGLLVETGVHADYLEHWRRLAHSDDGVAVMRKTAGRDARAMPAEFLMVAGRYVMHVRDRASGWLQGIRPDTALSELVTPHQFGLLDLEISFGERTGSGWRVRHSTLPWREGRDVDLRMGQAVEGVVPMRWDGVEAQWHIIEWTPPAR